MKICGIIAEYNPFHNGHKMQLKSAFDKSGADICIVIMSGMFTQRGDIAVASKYARAKMALSQGADVVVELPVCYALQPAEYFALGGVGILNALGTDYISYGTEAISDTDRNVIDDFVSITNSPTEDFEKEIKINLKSGMAYPQARMEAFKKISKHDNVTILKSPNAILEIAYRNAIYRLNSKIVPIPVPRVGDAYHQATPQSKITSATAIRNLIYSHKDYSNFMPEKCFDILNNYLSNNKAGHINQIYPYFIHTLAASPNTLANVSDGSEELYNRMINAISISNSMEEYIDNVSTRRFSSARVSRAVMHSVLNITSELIVKIRKELPLYARVLGVREESKDKLGILTKQSSIPIITSVAKHNLQTEIQRTMLDIDIAATNLYNLNVGNNNLYNQDYSQKLTIF